MCPVHKTAWILVWVGALNWGLVGLLDFNLVNTLLGAWPAVEKIVYVLVGLSALLMLSMGKCKMCMAGGEMKPPMGAMPGAPKM
ncbi:DUF378 domain-containing protein [Candidatus Uhrbacteria bacterium]|nr:DUF378 domain-containing protein [Candidatus Uhrbacteria bacterium]